MSWHKIYILFVFVNSFVRRKNLDCHHPDLWSPLAQPSIFRESEGWRQCYFYRHSHHLEELSLPDVWKLLSVTLWASYRFQLSEWMFSKAVKFLLTDTSFTLSVPPSIPDSWLLSHVTKIQWPLARAEHCAGQVYHLEHLPKHEHSPCLPLPAPSPLQERGFLWGERLSRNNYFGL